ncbi:hypothetical protein Bca4012_058318 [Brassica carinata]|uniref:UBC core domain-containing protein n=1 Tax=Brassica carinata TaxID=52824 RepID=A0A8X7W368_BRACI|nr:hypothetical protein Bca52824_016064 [Brassica carinata]
METPQSWDFFSGLDFPHQTNQTSSYSSVSSSTMVLPQAPDIVMVPAPPSRPFKLDGSGSSSRPVAPEHSKNRVKKVQADWQILENDLPETIFVRACESRMDLLRAVIIGAEGTPYHDGLFFFDIQFPDSYPSAPPKVHYHSGGLRIIPNLYNCGCQLTEAVQMVKRPCLSASHCQLSHSRRCFISHDFYFLRYTNNGRQNSSLNGIEYSAGWETLLSQKYQISDQTTVTRRYFTWIQPHIHLT